MSRIDHKSRTRLAAQGQQYQTAVRNPVILVVEDQPFWSVAMQQLCDFLGVRMERVGETDDLRTVLRDQRPLAVLSEMESPSVDGCDVLKLVGAHDPDLPVMLRTEGDPVLIGAAEAIQEILGLSGATLVECLPTPGEMMEFLFRAGQLGRCLGLMPA